MSKRDTTSPKPRGTSCVESREACTPSRGPKERRHPEGSGGDVDWQAVTTMVLELLGESVHDGIIRSKDGRPRCMAAYPGGKRCRRRARIRGMCVVCLRRDAAIWRRSHHAGT
jgi:hypothetical protein